MQRRPEFTRIRAELARSMHFRALAPEDLDRLAELCHLRHLRDGQVAGRADQPLNELWIVLHGALRLSTITVTGEEFVYAMLGRGSFYGLAHVIDGVNTIVDARANGPTELAAVDGREFLDLLDRRPRLWRHVVRILTRRLGLAMSVIRDLSVASLEERIARRLLGQALSSGLDLGGPQAVELRLTQADLGRMLGASRSKVNAALKHFEREGLVKVGYRTIKLDDLAGLRGIAGSDVFAF